jgi:hypothetical protein
LYLPLYRRFSAAVLSETGGQFRIKADFPLFRYRRRHGAGFVHYPPDQSSFFAAYALKLACLPWVIAGFHWQEHW